MLRLTNILSKEFGVALKDLRFEEGMIYGIRSHNWNFNKFMVSLLRGTSKPDNGSVYVTINDITNNLISADSTYLSDYSNKYMYISECVSLLDDFSVKENIAILRKTKFVNGITNIKITKILNMVHLTDGTKKINRLSAAERYRVKIAQLLCIEPKIVLCSNILNGLTDDEKYEVESLLCDACKHIKATLVYVGELSNDSNFDVVLSSNSIVVERYVV